MKEKKRLPILLGILLVAVIVTVGTTYAIWQLTLQQTTTNEITTGCFKVTFTDANPIDLEKAYPITDAEGKSLVPYEFTITNTCDGLASYQINLEVLNTTTLTDLSYMKMALNESTGTISPKLFTTNETVIKTLEDATTSYKLKTGYLNANESKTYHLRLWMDEDTPTSDAYMNKTLQSKITVTTSFLTEADTEVPVANFTISRNETGIVVDASASSDNKGINTYYYSTDGMNYVSSKDSSYTFTEGSIEYGIGTYTISKLYSSKVNEVYVYVEDALGNTSEVKKQIIGDLVYDETNDNNLRYVGANPSNYVYFNCDDNANPTADTCEKWRIIGSMNNIDNGTGTKETRLKIIRNESIGQYSWDTSASGVNDSYGINEWSQADAMKLLNPGHEKETVGGSLYWNRGSGTCYNERNNATTSCDFITTGLKETAKTMIGGSVWNIGANGHDASYNNILTSKFYELERSSNTGKICTSGSYCNDNVERTTTWKGIVGLMYPSDYGYATSGGNTTNRESCLKNYLYNWKDVSDCKKNDWLYKSGTYQWTLSPNSGSSSARYSFVVSSMGHVHDGVASYPNALSPILYLNTNVKIISGSGTSDSPFHLSEE